MKHVFLSYCHDNKDQAIEVHSALKDAGINLWWDGDITAGEDHKTAIRSAIQIARKVVVLFSRETQSRYENGIYPELRLAIERLRCLSPDASFIIPVRLADCDIPDFLIDPTTTLRDLVWIDFFGPNRNSEGLPRLLHALGGRGAEKTETESPLLQFGRPRPKLPHQHAEEISHEAASARQLRRKLLINDPESVDSSEVRLLDAQLLDLRRQLRDGPALREGDWLSDRYELIEPAGNGGFGTVWKAWDEDERVNELVAIKVLHGQFARSEERLDRFRRGSQAMQRLTHPNIVKVLRSCTEDSGYHYFVMEYMTGGTFADAVRARLFDHSAVIDLICQIGKALSFAHSHNAIHRDVTPDNILLGRKQAPKLTDFDLVRLPDSTGGTRTGALGKFVYASPESQSNAKDADGRSDVYSLGMTALFGLYGGDLAAADVIRSPERFIDHVDCADAVKRVLKTSIEFDPDFRYATVDEYCQSLRSAFRTSPQRQHHRETDKVNNDDAIGQSIEMDFESGIVSGILDVHEKGFGFLRSERAYDGLSVFVPVSVIQEHVLRDGLQLRGKIEPDPEGRGPRLSKLSHIEGTPVGEYKAAVGFDSLTAVSPHEQIVLERGPLPMSVRVIDLVCTIAKGQRILIGSQSRGPKDKMIIELADSIIANHDEMSVFLLLINARPEDVVEMRQRFGDRVMATIADEGSESHIQIAHRVLGRAKRIAERGQDVVIILDSITDAVRACSRRYTRSSVNRLDGRAFEFPQHFFESARQFEEGGSLTVLATARCNNGVRLDEIIFQEFEKTGDVELRLCDDLVRRDVWPPIDMQQSFTRITGDVLTEDDNEAIRMLRRTLVSLSAIDAMEQITRTLEKFPTNGEFLSRIRIVL